MSSTDSAERDLEHELNHEQAGHVGIPVDARCVGCKRIRVKRAPAERIEKGLSFKHVCHRCQRATHWNVLRVLDSLGGDHE